MRQCFYLRRLEKEKEEGVRKARSVPSLSLLNEKRGDGKSQNCLYHGNQAMSHKRASRFFFFLNLFRTLCILGKCSTIELCNQSLPHPFDSTICSGEMVRRAEPSVLGANGRAATTNVSLGAMTPHPVHTSASSLFSFSSMSLFIQS